MISVFIAIKKNKKPLTFITAARYPILKLVNVAHTNRVFQSSADVFSLYILIMFKSVPVFASARPSIYRPSGKRSRLPYYFSRSTCPFGVLLRP